jgi:hypothetical protein
MRRERIRACAIAAGLGLAGCGGGAAPDQTPAVLFDNGAVTLDQPAQDIVIRAASNGANRQAVMPAVRKGNSWTTSRI